jgi:hypothetical protein
MVASKAKISRVDEGKGTPSQTSAGEPYLSECLHGDVAARNQHGLPRRTLDGWPASGLFRSIGLF